MRIVGIAGVIVCLALAGCGARNIWREDAERINEAFPLGAEVVLARAKLVDAIRAIDPKQVAESEREYSRHVVTRALQCARGADLATLDSAQTIRGKLDPQCFIAADAELLAWIHGRRLVLMLDRKPEAAPLLAPPTLIALPAGTQLVEFAAQAPFFVASKSGRFDVVNYGNGRTAVGAELTAYRAPNRLSIAPNGRVVALTFNDLTELHDGESGELLISLRGTSQFDWLDSRTVLVRDRAESAPAVMDISTGKREPVMGVAQATQLIRLPVNPPRFLLVERQRVTKFGLRREGENVSAQILEQGNLPNPYYMIESATVTSDGARLAIPGQFSLTVMDTDHLVPTQVDLPDFRVLQAATLQAPKEVLLVGADRSGGATRAYVYDLDEGSLTEIDDSRVETQRLSGSAPTRVPFVNRVYLRNGDTLVLADGLKRGAKFGPQAIAAHLAELATEREHAFEREISAPYGIPGEMAYMAAHPLLGDLAKDTQVQAVGVYESANGPHASGGKRTPAPVDITVRRSNAPLVLVLSAYEPVIWRVKVTPGAKLRAILLGGYETQKVIGAGDVRVVDVGRVYAYEQGGQGFQQLNTYVLRWTGKTISNLQGRYAGSTFTVGDK